MLASAMTHPVTGAEFDAKYAGYMMDLKADGHRGIIVKRGEDVVCWSRANSGPALMKSLPAYLVDAVRELPDGIYDSELVVKGGQSWHVTEKTKQDQLGLMLFDVLELLGQDCKSETNAARREYLKLALAHLQSDASKAVVYLVPEFAPTWENVRKILDEGGEGAILKDPGARYQPGRRSEAWIKVVEYVAVVGVISGFRAGSFGPHAVTLLSGVPGIKSVKTKDSAILREIAKDPASWLGRRLVIKCRLRGGILQHPMWDHLAGEAE